METEWATEDQVGVVDGRWSGPDSAGRPDPTAVEERQVAVHPGPPAHGGPEGPEALVEVVDRLLDDVERALSRLDDGTYGRCGACGADIEDSRLAEEPTTQTCAACASPEGD
jgi:hypothetical protein